jgi:hypothetical protein
MAAQCIKAMLCQMLRPSSSYGHAAQARGTANDQTEAAEPKGRMEAKSMRESECTD